jgi:hypothetical protein
MSTRENSLEVRPGMSVQDLWDFLRMSVGQYEIARDQGLRAIVRQWAWRRRAMDALYELLRRTA